jgi:hypothetical protein
MLSEFLIQTTPVDIAVHSKSEQLEMLAYLFMTSHHLPVRVHIREYRGFCSRNLDDMSVGLKLFIKIRGNLKDMLRLEGPG